MNKDKVTKIHECPDFLHTPDNPMWHKVVIDGKLIPRMRSRERDDGHYEVLLDDRWVYIFSNKNDCFFALSMAANCLAIGEGYKFLGADDKNHPFAPTVRGL